MSDDTAKLRWAPVRRRAVRKRPGCRAWTAGALVVAVLLGGGGLRGTAQAQDPPAAARPEQARVAEDPSAQGVKVAEGAEAQMVEAFAQLADSDAAVREKARINLMGLERRYLPALQKLVERSRPLLPSQAAVLRQIVTHVYLAGEPYESNANLGFLGVRMLHVDVSTARPPGPPDAPEGVAPDAEALLSSRKGVVITERMPGFVGYRMLLDGDVIVGLTDQPNLEFHTQEDFSAAVRRVGAGQTVRFNILRRGRLAKVAITLDPRPEAAGDGQAQGPMDDLIARRRLKAETYWRQTFVPLLKERLG